jgi:hypothetical protein
MQSAAVAIRKHSPLADRAGAPKLHVSVAGGPMVRIHPSPAASPLRTLVGRQQFIELSWCEVVQKDGLLPLNQHALQVIGDIAYHDYEGTGRNVEERTRLLADLGDRHILVLRNHGLLIVGSSIAAAFVATYRMERACAMQLAFQQSGAAFQSITDEVVSAAYNHPPGGRNEPAKFEWPAHAANRLGGPPHPALSPWPAGLRGESSGRASAPSPRTQCLRKMLMSARADVAGRDGGAGWLRRQE